MRKTYIIAEAGVNHNGNIDVAKRMIDAAVEAGVDAVKFQTFISEKVISKFAPKAEYQKKTTGSVESQLDMVRRLELSKNDFRELYSYCLNKKINFLSTPFDLESIGFLNGLGIEIFKVPSGEVTNLPYLRKVGSLKKRVIMSTGMADMEEVRVALDVLASAGTDKEKITILHCTTDYPASFSDVNLLAMQAMKDTFKVAVGYSDHTLGIEVPVAAVALGATVIEKHFTLDRALPGPDHSASLVPEELKSMVRAIRNIEVSLGKSAKIPSAVELNNRRVVRKSIIALADIKAGQVFTEDNIAVKRPGVGISPMKWDSVIGRKAKKDFKEDELIEL